jgi:hypothetical protein
VPFRIFELEQDGRWTSSRAQVEEGNPDLDPLESMNLGFCLGGVVPCQPAAFSRWRPVLQGHRQPDLSRSVTTCSKTSEFEGRFFSELERSRPENAVSGDILGLEFNYQQQFTRASRRPSSGLGVSLNYTWI